MSVPKAAAEFGDILVTGDLKKSCSDETMVGTPDWSGLRHCGRQEATKSVSLATQGRTASQWLEVGTRLEVAFFPPYGRDLTKFTRINCLKRKNRFICEVFLRRQEGADPK